MALKPIILFSKVHKVHKIRVFTFIQKAMRKRKHDTEDSPGIQTQLPLTLFQRQLMLMTIAYPLFSYIFHVEFAFFSTGCFQEKH